jgi:hypothetical protein
MNKFADYASEICDWYFKLGQFHLFVWKPDYLSNFPIKNSWALHDGDNAPALVTPWFTFYWW